MKIIFNYVSFWLLKCIRKKYIKPQQGVIPKRSNVEDGKITSYIAIFYNILWYTIIEIKT